MIKGLPCAASSLGSKSAWMIGTRLHRQSSSVCSVCSACSAYSACMVRIVKLGPVTSPVNWTVTGGTVLTVRTEGGSEGVSVGQPWRRWAHSFCYPSRLQSGLPPSAIDQSLSFASSLIPSRLSRTLPSLPFVSSSSTCATPPLSSLSLTPAPPTCFWCVVVVCRWSFRSPSFIWDKLPYLSTISLFVAPPRQNEPAPRLASLLCRPAADLQSPWLRLKK